MVIFCEDSELSLDADVVARNHSPVTRKLLEVLCNRSNLSKNVAFDQSPTHNTSTSQLGDIVNAPLTESKLCLVWSKLDIFKCNAQLVSFPLYHIVERLKVVICSKDERGIGLPSSPDACRVVRALYFLIFTFESL